MKVCEEMIAADVRRSARRRAESCFRLASHPNTSEEEREAAIDRGTRIIERYDLDADRFNFPGKEGKAETVSRTGICETCSRPGVKLYGTVCSLCAMSMGHAA